MQRQSAHRELSKEVWLIHIEELELPDFKQNGSTEDKGTRGQRALSEK